MERALTYLRKECEDLKGRSGAQKRRISAGVRNTGTLPVLADCLAGISRLAEIEEPG